MGTFHRWQLLQTVTADVTRRGTEMSDGTNGEAVCKWFGHGHNVWVTIDGEIRVGPHIASSEEATLNEFKD